MGPRRDQSGPMRAWYEAKPARRRSGRGDPVARGQAGGPAKVLVHLGGVVVGLPARRARAGAPGGGRGLELRIFPRDGQRSARATRPSLAEAPDSNADIMAEFLNDKNGQTWQSIPVAVFYTEDLEYLYHYTEFPAIYHKDRWSPATSARRARGRARRHAGARDREFASPAAVALLPALGQRGRRRDHQRAAPAPRRGRARLRRTRPTAAPGDDDRRQRRRA